MKKISKSTYRAFSLILCMALTLGIFGISFSQKVDAATSAASRYGETYVHVDEFDTYTDEDAKHFEFLGNENGTFTITGFTTGSTTNNGVTITAKGSGADPVNGYLSAVLVNANKTLNQYVQADFTKTSKYPMVWVRANKETLNDVEYLIGYFACWDNTYYRLFKAEIVNGKYTLTQLARCGRMTTVNNADFLSIEISAVGANPTVLNVKTYKNISGSYQLHDVQTVTDTTASLQQKGTAALSAYGTSADFLKLVYHSDDGATPNTYLLNESAKTGVLAGTVLTVEQNKTYEFSYITGTDKITNEADNDPVFIKYVSETKSGSNSVLKNIDGFNFVRENYNGYNKFSGTFMLNTTDYTDLFYSYNLIATAEDTPNKTNYVNVPIAVGIEFNNATKDNSKYKEFTVREVITNDDGTVTYGPNLIANGTFTLGAFNWSSELNVGINIGNGNNDALGVITGVQMLDNISNRYMAPNGRMSVWQESNNFEYHYGFLYDPENAVWGDANSDGEIDIRDLVCAKKITSGELEYNIFADLTSYDAKLEVNETDGEITANDLASLRKILLFGSKKNS